MSLFPDTMIEQVRGVLTPEAVLRRIDYRPEMIQDTGPAIKCFCPIHKETIFRTLLVDKASGTYRCSNYHCPGKQGGDLIDLYARALNMSYEQALIELAGAFGVPVDLAVAEQYVATTLEVAQNYLELGVLAEAEEHLDRILRFKPDCLPALRALLRVHEAAGRAPAAREVRLRLAQALAEQGDLSEAIELIRRHVSESPDDHARRLQMIEWIQRSGNAAWAAGEYVNLADELAAAGEIDRALAMYRAAADLKVEDIDVSLHIIQLLVAAGRRDEAVAEHLKQAERRLATPDPEGAAASLEAALELDPTREELVVQLAEVVAGAQLGGDPLDRVVGHIGRLLAARAHGAAARALETLEAAFPGRPPLMALRADLEEARGNAETALDLRLQCVDQLQQRRRLDEALAVLERAMAGRADNVALLSRKANLLRELGRVADAIEVYRAIIELFVNADEHEHAAAVYQTVIDLEPDQLEHRQRQFELYLKLGLEPIIVQKAMALAEALHERKRPAEAVALLGQAIERVPQSVELLVRQAELFEELGRRGEAAEQFHTVAKLLYDRGRLDHARQMVERALRNVPEHLPARETLADVLVAQSMTLQAMGIYTDLAEFYLREKEADAAIRLCRKILTMQPEHMPTLLMLAKAYGLAGEEEKQLATQTRLVQLYLQGQSYTRATELCEEILNRHEDYTPALEQLVAIAESTRQSGQSVKYLWKLSQVHARAGRHEMELGILEQILEKAPLHDGAWFRRLELMLLWATPRALADAVDQMVQRFEQAGRGDDAVQILEDLAATPNPKPELFGGLARLYRGRGDRERLAGALRRQAELLGRLMRDEEALDVWGRLADLLPDDLNILRTRIEIMLRNAMNLPAAEEYRRLAQALAQRGRHEEAEVALLEVLNLNPRDAAARDELISLLIRTGAHRRAAEQIEDAAARLLEENHFAEAIAVYERVFEFDPTREDTYRRIIAIRRRMGDPEGAMAMYGRLLDCLEAKQAFPEFEAAAHEALELQPDHAGLRRRLAEYLIAQQRPLEAESQLLALAVAQIGAQQWDDAETTIARILEINPDSVPARAHRAQLMARRGRSDEALSEFLQLTDALARGGGGAAAAEAAAPFQRGNYEGIRLIKDYTFETFIVGARNNFAYATALAVSRAPARNYNPLFLYSDVGLGKTHLCHAIAHAILERHPQLKVIYTTTEEFVADLIDAIQSNSIAPWRNRHKLTDVLIVDDVQFLAGKERAQEEFFNIFNALYQAGKQIVLTSDRPPKDISHLEKRLKSRFGAGIIVDIQPPDLETRIAILRRELAVRGRDDALSDEVIQYVAERLESNVRELKGALNQLLARQELVGERIDLVTARAVLHQNLTDA